jgi:phage terminase small subunit
MPQPRKPTLLHVIQGTRSRVDRSGEPRDLRPLGEPPATLRGAALAAWREIAASLAPGVLSAGDRFALEIVARLLAKMRTPAGLTAAEIARLQRGLASLGMTPADRSRVAPVLAKPEPAGSPWDSL